MDAYVSMLAIEDFGGEFRVIVSRQETMDELLIRAEYAVTHANSARQDALRHPMRDGLQIRPGIHPVIELAAEGTIPRSEFRARRVVADRDICKKGTVS